MENSEREVIRSSIGVIKGDCVTCGEQFFAPVFTDVNKNKIPAVNCEECVVTTIKQEGIYTEQDEKDIRHIYELARFSIN